MITQNFNKYDTEFQNTVLKIEQMLLNIVDKSNDQVWNVNFVVNRYSNNTFEYFMEQYNIPVQITSMNTLSFAQCEQAVAAAFDGAIVT